MIVTNRDRRLPYWACRAPLRLGSGVLAARERGILGTEPAS